MVLLVHPGYGKTATTWLQTRALPRTGVWLLAKGSAGDGTEAFWDAGVRDLQYRIFSPAMEPSSMWRRYRNSAPAIRRYARSIADQLNAAGTGLLPDSAKPQDAVNRRIAVLSDETMLGYGGLEVNAPLLSYLLTMVKSYVTDPDELSIEVVLTIREQVSLLRSLFAYSFEWYRRSHRCFEAFLDSGLSNPCEGVFGTLFYDDAHSFLTSTLPDFARVRMVPYELLEEEGAACFVGAFLGVEPSSLSWSGPVPPAVNTQADTGYRLRAVYQRHRAFRQLERVAMGAPRPFRQVAATIVESGPARAVLPPEPIRTLRRKVEVPEEYHVRLREIYAASNRSLDTRLQLGLERLGYAV